MGGEYILYPFLNIWYIYKISSPKNKLSKFLEYPHSEIRVPSEKLKPAAKNKLSNGLFKFLLFPKARDLNLGKLSTLENSLKHIATGGPVFMATSESIFISNLS